MIVGRGMTRAPVVRFPDAKRASELLFWIQDPSNFVTVQRTFESTSRFACLKSVSFSSFLSSIFLSCREER